MQLLQQKKCPDCPPGLHIILYTIKAPSAPPDSTQSIQIIKAGLAVILGGCEDTGNLTTATTSEADGPLIILCFGLCLYVLAYFSPNWLKLI